MGSVAATVHIDRYLLIRKVVPRSCLSDDTYVQQRVPVDTIRIAIFGLVSIPIFYTT